MLSCFSCVRLFSTAQTVAHQAPPSMAFSRQEYWSGLPFPSPGNLPHPGIEPWSLKSPSLQACSLPLVPRGKPLNGLFSSVAQSDSLWPHGLQCTRLTCPSPTPRGCSNSCPSSWWCHPTVSSSVVPFSSCLQSFPASGSFPMSQLFAWGGQSI